MGSNTKVKTDWKCDVCDKEESTNDYGAPKGWYKFDLRVVLSDRARRPVLEGVACDECCGDLDFMRSDPARQIGGKNNVGFFRRVLKRLKGEKVG